MSWSRGYRTLPNQGGFEFGPFFESLGATGYEGPISLECFSGELRAMPANKVAAAGREALRASRGAN